MVGARSTIWAARVARRAAREAGPFDQQHRRLLVTRQPAVLAAADTDRLVPPRHRRQRAPGTPYSFGVSSARSDTAKASA